MAKPVDLTIKFSTEGLDELRSAAEAFAAAIEKVKITAETVNKEDK